MPTESPLAPIVSDASFEDKKTAETQEYKEQVQELLDMRASLNRLVSLESDLSFLLEEMSKVEEQNPSFGFEEASEGSDEQSTIVFAPNGKSSDLDKNNLASLGELIPAEQTNMLDKIQAEDLDREKLNLLGKDVAKESLKVAERQDVDGSKFSNLVQQVPKELNEVGKVSRLTQLPSARQAKASAVEVLPAPLIRQMSNKIENKSGVNTSKFASVKGSKLDMKTSQSAANYSCTIQTRQDAAIGVHLASYSTKELAIKGWKMIQSKYAQDLCSDAAKVSMVTVKEKNYFSLRVGGYLSKDDASLICQKLRAKSQYCALSTYEGESL